jgi:hypothetical protein
MALNNGPRGYRLVIGSKNTSSWNLRPWLAMRQAGIPFEEIKIELRSGQYRALLPQNEEAKVAAARDLPAAPGHNAKNADEMRFD